MIRRNLQSRIHVEFVLNTITWPYKSAWRKPVSYFAFQFLVWMDCDYIKFDVDYEQLCGLAHWHEVTSCYYVNWRFYFCVQRCGACFIFESSTASLYSLRRKSGFGPINPSFPLKKYNRSRGSAQELGGASKGVYTGKRSGLAVMMGRQVTKTGKR